MCARALSTVICSEGSAGFVYQTPQVDAGTALDRVACGGLAAPATSAPCVAYLL